MPEFRTVAGQRFVRYRRNDSIIWGTLAIAMVGIGFLGIGIRDSVTREAFLSESLSAPGTITELQTAGGHDPGYRPVVQFTPEGTAIPITFRSPYVSGQHYSEGEPVVVRYLPQNPASANLEDVLLSQKFTAGYVLIGMTVLLAAGGLLTRFSRWIAVREPHRQVSFR